MQSTQTENSIDIFGRTFRYKIFTYTNPPKQKILQIFLVVHFGTRYSHTPIHPNRKFYRYFWSYISVQDIHIHQSTQTENSIDIFGRTFRYKIFTYTNPPKQKILQIFLVVHFGTRYSHTPIHPNRKFYRYFWSYISVQDIHIHQSTQTENSIDIFGRTFRYKIFTYTNPPKQKIYRYFWSYVSVQDIHIHQSTQTENSIDIFGRTFRYKIFTYTNPPKQKILEIFGRTFRYKIFTYTNPPKQKILQIFLVVHFGTRYSHTPIHPNRKFYRYFWSYISVQDIHIHQSTQTENSIDIFGRTFRYKIFTYTNPPKQKILQIFLVVRFGTRYSHTPIHPNRKFYRYFWSYVSVQDIHIHQSTQTENSIDIFGRTFRYKIFTYTNPPKQKILQIFLVVRFGTRYSHTPIHPNRKFYRYFWSYVSVQDIHIHQSTQTENSIDIFGRTFRYKIFTYTNPPKQKILQIFLVVRFGTRYSHTPIHPNRKFYRYFWSYVSVQDIHIHQSTQTENSIDIFGRTFRYKIFTYTNPPKQKILQIFLVVRFGTRYSHTPIHPNRKFYRDFWSYVSVQDIHIHQSTQTENSIDIFGRTFRYKIFTYTNPPKQKILQIFLVVRFGTRYSHTPIHPNRKFYRYFWSYVSVQDIHIHQSTQTENSIDIFGRTFRYKIFTYTNPPKQKILQIFLVVRFGTRYSHTPIHPNRKFYRYFWSYVSVQDIHIHQSTQTENSIDIFGRTFRYKIFTYTNPPKQKILQRFLVVRFGTRYSHTPIHPNRKFYRYFWSYVSVQDIHIHQSTQTENSIDIFGRTFRYKIFTYTNPPKQKILQIFLVVRFGTRYSHTPIHPNRKFYRYFWSYVSVQDIHIHQSTQTENSIDIFGRTFRYKIFTYTNPPKQKILQIFLVVRFGTRYSHTPIHPNRKFYRYFWSYVSVQDIHIHQSTQTENSIDIFGRTFRYKIFTYTNPPKQKILQIFLVVRFGTRYSHTPIHPNRKFYRYFWSYVSVQDIHIHQSTQTENSIDIFGRTFRYKIFTYTNPPKQKILQIFLVVRFGTRYSHTPIHPNRKFYRYFWSYVSVQDIHIHQSTQTENSIDIFGRTFRYKIFTYTNPPKQKILQIFLVVRFGTRYSHTPIHPNRKFYRYFWSYVSVQDIHIHQSTQTENSIDIFGRTFRYKIFTYTNPPKQKILQIFLVVRFGTRYSHTPIHPNRKFYRYFWSYVSVQDIHIHQSTQTENSIDIFGRTFRYKIFTYTNPPKQKILQIFLVVRFGTRYSHTPIHPNRKFYRYFWSYVSVQDIHIHQSTQTENSIDIFGRTFRYKIFTYTNPPKQKILQIFLVVRFGTRYSHTPIHPNRKFYRYFWSYVSVQDIHIHQSTQTENSIDIFGRTFRYKIFTYTNPPKQKILQIFLVVRFGTRYSHTPIHPNRKFYRYFWSYVSVQDIHIHQSTQTENSIDIFGRTFRYKIFTYTNPPKQKILQIFLVVRFGTRYSHTPIHPNRKFYRYFWSYVSVQDIHIHQSTQTENSIDIFGRTFRYKIFTYTNPPKQKILQIFLVVRFGTRYSHTPIHPNRKFYRYFWSYVSVQDIHIHQSTQTENSIDIFGC